MSRVRKVESDHHAFRMTEDGRELLLVGGAKPYLWVGPDAERIEVRCYTFGGNAALLALADAIRSLIPPQEK